VSEEITVPSGQVVTLLQVITDTAGPDGLTVRFRFLAPGVAKDGGTVDADTAAKDMDALCQDYALPRVAGAAAGADRDFDVGHGCALWRDASRGHAIVQLLFHPGRSVRMGYVLRQEGAASC